MCDAFDNSHVQYISDTLHIIRSVLNPQFIHYTKYAKYAFLLLFSISARAIMSLSVDLDETYTMYDCHARIQEFSSGGGGGGGEVQVNLTKRL